MTFSEIIGGLFIIIGIFLLASPYFSLTYLKDIHNDLSDIHYELKKMNQGKP